MGARGQAATSGMAETSRIAVDNRYRSDLNSLGQARLSARAAAQNAADEQTAAAESSYYTAIGKCGAPAGAGGVEPV